MKGRPLVFVSYSRDDEQQVDECVADLEAAGCDVWLDKRRLIPGQNWPEEIRRAIGRADQFLVFISSSSHANWRTQQNEINQALLREESEQLKNWIVPVRLHECRLPQGLQHRHCVDAFKEGGWNHWIQSLHRTVGTREPRATSMAVGGLSLRLPVFFPSLSTAAKTTVGVEAHMALLLRLRHPQFLVSAADIFHLRTTKQEDSRKIAEHLTEARRNNQVVLLDSGNYEKYWQKLDWKVANFHEVLSYAPVSLAFCFDDLNPPENAEQNMEQIEASTNRDRRENKLDSMLPIVHCTSPEEFPRTCQGIAERLQPLLIGVPERELGAALLERVRTVVKIRRALDATGYYRPLHLLGTGNPISLLAFFLAGADSFDGLEWCQTVVDVETARLHHLSHYDLFAHQSIYGEMDISTASKCLAHNLRFYRYWMEWLQTSPRTDLLESLEHFVGDKAWPQLKRALDDR